MVASAVFALALVAPLSGVAQAHFNLVMPPPADNDLGGGKGAPPCGPTTPSNVVTPVQGGHALHIALNETVMHPGHYRFALSINSRSELPADPVAVVAANGNSISAPVQNPPVFPIIADGVFDHTTGTAPIPFSTDTVILPNITCAKCTLQVIEFMAQHGANVGGGFYYHHCADLQITADPALPGPGSGTGGASGNGTGGQSGGGADAGPTTPGNTGGGGCALGGRPTRVTGWATFALLGLALTLHRRRR